MVCSTKSVALKAYNRSVMKTMSVYVVTVLCVAWFVKRHHPTGVLAYVLAILPALPVIGMLAVMGIYLRDEKDEFLRWITIRSLLIGTAALMGTVVISDFLRAFTQTGNLPPFICFVIFFLAFGAAQMVQRIQNRSVGDE